MEETNVQRDFANVPVTWEPKEDSAKNLKAFTKRLEEKYNINFGSYWDLHKWSVDNLDKFWAEIWDSSGIIYSKNYEKVIDSGVPMYEFQNWFDGARLNYAENVLRYRDERVALIVAGEDTPTRKFTYAQVYAQVSLYAAALRKHGVKKGDKIACFMSNRKEAIFAMLGGASIGAIWLGALPLMGPQAVLSRFKQVEPKILFTVDRFPHNNEERDNMIKLKEISENLPSLEKVVIVASKPESKSKDISGIRNSCFLDEFLDSGKNVDGSCSEIHFEQLPFTHPVFINYTSGTTGLPKAFVHSGSHLLTTYRDWQLLTTSDRSDCWLTMSPVGWATWNLFLSLLFLGQSIVVFEGVPYFQSPTFFWDMIEEFSISSFLFTPTIIEDMERKGYLPTPKHHLSSIKLVMIGGSVVKPQNFNFFYNRIKKDAIFMNAYALTELNGAIILMMVETLKIHSDELSAPTLGTDVTCLDACGKEIVGDIGDIVVKKTSPTLPNEIVGDIDRSRYKVTYFDKYPGKFSTGDLAMINPVTKGFIICGRSDETLKARGCRFGSSEIYIIVDTFPEVHDSLCVSHYNSKRDERAVLFLKMKQGHLFNQELEERIRKAIARELSSRHVPEVILETKDIPHNMNGKKMEIIVKKIINKMPYNPETVVNAECLEGFKNLSQLGEFI